MKKGWIFSYHVPYGYGVLIIDNLIIHSFDFFTGEFINGGYSVDTFSIYAGAILMVYRGPEDPLIRKRVKFTL